LVESGDEQQRLAHAAPYVDAGGGGSVETARLRICTYAGHVATGLGTEAVPGRSAGVSAADVGASSQVAALIDR